VRLSDAFLKSDPPTSQELRACRKHIRALLIRARIPPLAAGGQLVGTGGTIRNLAKIDRARRRYPLTRLHGYVLEAPRLRAAGRLLRARKTAARASIDGLNSNRADTIVAGALVVQTVMQALQATDMVVSGQGLREGIVIAQCDGGELSASSTVRRVAVGDLIEVFAHDRGEEAERRTRIAVALAAGADLGDASVGEVLRVAAALLDIGRSVDYYNRHRHTEQLVLAHGLAGFSHREHALVCGIVRAAGEPKYDLDAYSEVLSKADRESAARAATILAVADELERRIPPHALVEYSAIAGRLAVRGAPVGWNAGDITDRFEKTFGRSVEVMSAE
jgi:exopolyphosphatase/guanosine-5'-triphosphate,3'-diphosphate pyrophosphatase